MCPSCMWLKIPRLAILFSYNALPRVLPDMHTRVGTTCPNKKTSILQIWKVYWSIFSMRSHQPMIYSQNQFYVRNPKHDESTWIIFQKASLDRPPVAFQLWHRQTSGLSEARAWSTRDVTDAGFVQVNSGRWNNLKRTKTHWVIMIFTFCSILDIDVSFWSGFKLDDSFASSRYLLVLIWLKCLHPLHNGIKQPSGACVQMLVIWCKWGVVICLDLNGNSFSRYQSKKGFRMRFTPRMLQNACHIQTPWYPFYRDMGKTRIQLQESRVHVTSKIFLKKQTVYSVTTSKLQKGWHSHRYNFLSEQPR